MRTDGVNLSAEAVDSLRDLIGGQYGASYLPPAGLRVYKTRAKNAQEAHEAIRPTNPALLPSQVQGLTPDQVGGANFTPVGLVK
jgi:DNA topoisomerase-1